MIVYFCDETEYLILRNANVFYFYFALNCLLLFFCRPRGKGLHSQETVKEALEILFRSKISYNKPEDFNDALLELKEILSKLKKMFKVTF